jgi:hypothetical protein
MARAKMRQNKTSNIASIDLTSNKAGYAFSDGSGITGEATFTRTNGTKGVVAEKEDYDPYFVDAPSHAMPFLPPPTMLGKIYMCGGITA